MVVDDAFITGRLTPQVKSRVTKRLNKAIEGHGAFKIGKTGDAWVRTDQNDYRKDYYKFHLIFRSSSKLVIDTLECDYIKRYMRSHPENCRNRSAHRLGRMYSYDGYYWLYVVTC